MMGSNIWEFVALPQGDELRKNGRMVETDEAERMLNHYEELRQQLERAEARVAELEATLYHGNLEREKCQKAMVLRKQAEAVEPAIRTALRNLGNAHITESDISRFAEDYAQRLLQQAADIEKGGSHD